MTDIKKAQKIFVEFLSRNNFKVTYERKKILDEIFKIQDHFDAEGLYLKFKNEDINISRATIYRTLDLLVESKLVSKIRFSDNSNKYEKLLGTENHSHLICQKCGKIEEFSSNKIDEITKKIASNFGYTNYKHHFKIYGVCKECSKNLKEPIKD